MEKYLDPFTDFGFKLIFFHKELIRDFLNAVFQGRIVIADLSFSNNEQLTKNVRYRKAFFDVHCTDSNGNKFIVELQNAKQEFFADRSLYYVSFAVQEQAPKGNWNYELNRIYLIASWILFLTIPIKTSRYTK